MRTLFYRSSDSAKYGTNKSSGASVTSGHQAMTGHHHQLKIGPFGQSALAAAHDSVSNRKPPVHPNHNTNLSTPIGGSRQSIIAPVHSSNNRLYNNTTFQNNQYTFSLNREGASGHASGGVDSFNNGGGFLSSHPLANTSPYAVQGGVRSARGTKSDIGISCRRPSTSSSSTTSKHTARSSNGNSRTRSSHHNQQQLQQSHQSSNNSKSSRIPSVKSDFLLSYLSNSANMCETGSPYQISSGIQPTTADYLEHYKASLLDHGRMYNPPKSFSSTVDVSSYSMGQSEYLRQHQRSYQNHNLQHPMKDPSTRHIKTPPVRTHNPPGNANVGPLLYLDSAEAAASAAHFDRRPNQEEVSTRLSNVSSAACHRSVKVLSRR